jgi:hypothetical protein
MASAPPPTEEEKQIALYLAKNYDITRQAALTHYRNADYEFSKTNHGVGLKGAPINKQTRWIEETYIPLWNISQEEHGEWGAPINLRGGKRRTKKNKMYKNKGKKWNTKRRNKLVRKTKKRQIKRKRITRRR